MQPFYSKDEAEAHDDGSNYFGYSGADKEGFGSPQQVPFGGMYNQMMSPGGTQGHPLVQRPGGLPPGAAGGKYSPRGGPGMGARAMPQMTPGSADSMGIAMPRGGPDFTQQPGARQYSERGPTSAGATPGIPTTSGAGGRERRMSYNSTLHEGLGSKGLQAGATTDASEFPSLGSADQFPSLGNGSRAIGGASPGVAGVGVGASSPGLPGSSRGAALGGGSGSTGLGMPQFGMQGNLIYGKKQGGKREGFNAMSEDMFPSLPGVKLKLGGSPLELDDDPTFGSGVGGGDILGSQTHDGTSPQSLMGAGRSIEDRYRLIGLLPIVRNPSADLKMMALGVDLTTLGLNLNSPDVLFPSFESPWADVRCPLSPLACVGTAPLPCGPSHPPLKMSSCDRKHATSIAPYTFVLGHTPTCEWIYRVQWQRNQKSQRSTCRRAMLSRRTSLWSQCGSRMSPTTRCSLSFTACQAISHSSRRR
eukprot:m.69815 g.69815  ORF g.69815 m.69815 type:complete len:475 (-) comp18431_c0_seq4:2410-3834(-)